jgi:hypothetical protein
MRCVIRLAVAGLTLVGALPLELYPQDSAGSQLYIYAFDGGLAPLRDRVDEPGVVMQERFAPLFGGGVGWWSRGRLGLEGSFGLAPSTARATGSGEYASVADGRSTFAGAGFARLLVAVSEPGLPLLLVAGVGGGGVLHWGGAYRGVAGRLDPAGIVSVGVRLRLGRCVYGRGEVANWTYPARFTDVPGIGTTRSRWQYDLALSLGAELLLGNC